VFGLFIVCVIGVMVMLVIFMLWRY